MFLLRKPSREVLSKALSAKHVQNWFFMSLPWSIILGLLSWPSFGPKFCVIWLLKMPASGWGLLRESFSFVSWLILNMFRTSAERFRTDPHRKAGIFNNQMTQNSGPEDGHDMVTGVREDIRNHHVLTWVHEEVTYELKKLAIDAFGIAAHGIIGQLIYAKIHHTLKNQ